jgi:putative aminopeptidase FrvX
LGSIVAEKIGDPDGPRIMIAGHMDEIGFLVSEITEEGYLKFIPAGGGWGHVVLSQQFLVTTQNGKQVLGVVGSKPPHILSAEEKTKVVDLKDMYLDIGVANKEEAGVPRNPNRRHGHTVDRKPFLGQSQILVRKSV